MNSSVVDLLKRVKGFVQERWDQQRPLLLGYSGGPDSKALLYALVELKLPLHVAHVDHGWRGESRDEAARLADEVGKLGLPFHSVRLSEKPAQNLEEAGRIARLRFFRSLFDQTPFAALLLAHQAEDRAETALKRLLEGAHLAYLGGLAPVAELEGMPVWRPLLGVRKRDIYNFLQERELEFLLDKTNEDPRFLRTRLRQTAIPQLQEAFGKEIVGNLELLSERAFELQEYLDRKVASAWEQRLEGDWGSLVRLDGLERVEARHLVQKLGLSEGLRLPRTILEPILEAALGGAFKRLFQFGGRTFLVGRGCAVLFALNFNGEKPFNIKDLLASSRSC